MSITYEESNLLDKVGLPTTEGGLQVTECELVNLTFKFLYSKAKELDVKLAKDDRSAKFEAAIIKFIVDSK